MEAQCSILGIFPLATRINFATVLYLQLMGLLPESTAVTPPALVELSLLSSTCSGHTLR
jgi:hypothetical protein